ncbi:4'-phosphopantetheinyl transferase superfamily [Chytriomyces sp. MP71]|nr:4'-phosphopantetheinyl transferase superfamily [Chytriomyces sp. MP71]
MILGIGTDLVHIPRITSLLRRSRATAGTIHETVSNGSHEGIRSLEWEAAVTRHLASRFAVKEAAFKAMMPHLRLNWDDVSVLSHGGKPILELSPRVTDKLGSINSHVSISHDGEYAMAMVLFEHVARSNQSHQSK